MLLQNHLAVSSMLWPSSKMMTEPARSMSMDARMTGSTWDSRQEALHGTHTPDDEVAFQDVVTSRLLTQQQELLRLQLLAAWLAVWRTVQAAVTRAGVVASHCELHRRPWPHQVAVGAEDDLGVMRKFLRGKVGACRQAPALACQVLDVVHLHGTKLHAVTCVCRQCCAMRLCLRNIDGSSRWRTQYSR